MNRVTSKLSNAVEAAFPDVWYRVEGAGRNNVYAVKVLHQPVIEVHSGEVKINTPEQLVDLLKTRTTLHKVS